MTAELGTVKLFGFDADGYEQRERMEAVVDCDTCGKEVELWSDSTAWVELSGGCWKHSEYGPAQGTCCQNLYVDSFEGCFRYKLEHSQ